MPRKKITFNRADVRAAWELMEKMGVEPVAAKFLADGVFRISTLKAVEIIKPDNSAVDANPWDEILPK